MDNLTCFEHTEALAPFSFLYFLVINRSAYSVEELRQITLHEKAHIRQWHTVDILLAEIVHAFLWINPLLPIIKRHIKLNLEFIADESVLTAGIDRKNYQLSIINSALSRSSYPLTNLFNSSKLKRRITMMNANQSPMRHLYKYLFMLPMVAVAYFIVNPVMAGHPMKNRADYNLQDLKAFEGYYQFEQDKDNYIQIFSKNGHLKLKQLWDNKEIPFEQKSDLEFNNREHSFSIVFSKDSKGAITSLLAFGRDVWNKVESYNPVVKNEIPLPAEQVRVFEGMYKLKGNRSDLFLQFIAHGNQLIAKEMWTGKEIVTLPESSMQFFGKDIRYPVTFIKDSKGKVTTAIVFNKDTWEKVEHYRPKKEITLSSQALKAFEGKYRVQFEKDKYSFIQVDVEGNGLLMKELWEEKEFHFVPESDLAFFSPDRYLTVKFTKDEHGKIIHALVFNKDLWEKMD